MSWGEMSLLNLVIGAAEMAPRKAEQGGDWRRLPYIRGSENL